MVIQRKRILLIGICTNLHRTYLLRKVWINICSFILAYTIKSYNVMFEYTIWDKICITVIFHLFLLKNFV